jgi:hypothetical protein
VKLAIITVFEFNLISISAALLIYPSNRLQSFIAFNFLNELIDALGNPFLPDSSPEIISALMFVEL